MAAHEQVPLITAFPCRRCGSMQRRTDRSAERSLLDGMPMDEDLRGRSAEDVFDDHLALAAEHRFDDDIERNFAPHCVVLERRGIFHGHKAVRELALLLEEELPDAAFTTPGGCLWTGSPS